MSAMEIDDQSVLEDRDPSQTSLSLASRRSSLRRLLSSSRRASLVPHATSLSPGSLPQVHPPALAQTIVKSLAFIPIIPRISSAWREFATNQKRAIASPLHQQKKVFEDLLELTRDNLPNYIRRSALKLLFISFHHLIQRIFEDCVRSQFMSALNDLCRDELVYAERMQGFTNLYYLVGSGASIHYKDFALECEDCRAILIISRNTSYFSLKLAAFAYLWLILRLSENRPYTPISANEYREICLALSDLIVEHIPLAMRERPIEWLWRFESTAQSSLSQNERRLVWNVFLDCTRADQKSDGLIRAHTDISSTFVWGMQRLWWFAMLPAWTFDFQDGSAIKKEIGLKLYSLVGMQHTTSTRTLAFELLALFANLSHWDDMLDQSQWRDISNLFAIFCLHDEDRINEANVMRRVQSILIESNDNKTITVHRAIQVTNEVSVVISRKHDQVAAITDSVHKNRHPSNSKEAALENLLVFTLPTESLLIHKNHQAILYERICNYAQFQQTRDIAVQALFALLTIQEWLFKIGFAKGPPIDGE